MAWVATLSDSSYGFDQPTGIAAHLGNLWVTNEAGQSLTELSASTGALIQVITSDDYYLPTPGPITYGDGYFFAASPPGSSPMITQITASTASVNWMMCNTNGPYDFNNPQSLVVAGADLWVVNEGGTSLTEMNARSGKLIATIS
jgi:hypothetical protein